MPADPEGSPASWIASAPRALPRQDRHPVPGTLAQPDHAIAEVTKGRCGKCSLLYLELLEANDVGLRRCEICREIMQTLVDVVESGDLQWPDLARKDILA